MREAVSTIHQQVAMMYEQFPYPSYPLLLRLQWWQAYLSSMAFCQALLPLESRQEHSSRIILLAGCGDTQPYIHRKLEPRQNVIVACDLASSNLRRARFRLLLDSRQVIWQQADILKLRKVPSTSGYTHIDCYGVLHHMANPRQGLIHLSQLLAEGGTMRLMVYNRKSRDWIWHIRQVFRLLQLDYRRNRDLQIAQAFLSKIARYHPGLKQYLQAMDRSLRIPARFVDTFFHVREARVSIGDWYRTFESSGLKLLGQFDRFAELDELENPLWQPPQAEQLEERASDRRFEHNLEWYLFKPHRRPQQKAAPFSQAPCCHLAKLKLHAAPRLWRQYPETINLSPLICQKLWWAHINFVYGTNQQTVDHLLFRIPEASIQRLARVGAFFPAQLRDKALLQLAYSPMEAECCLPDRQAWPMEDAKLREFLEPIIRDKPCSSKLHHLIRTHLSRIRA